MPTITIQRGTLGTVIDNEPISYQPTTNAGAAITISPRSYASFPQNVVIQFDLTQIPAGAIINSANLVLYNTASTTCAITTYRILTANSGWTEMGSTWNTKDGSAPWAGGSSGCGISGTDYDAIALGATTTIIAIGSYSISLNLTEFGLMQANNAGLLLIANLPGFPSASFDAYCILSSSEDSPVANRPALVVSYTLGSGSGAGNLLLLGVG